MVNKTLKQLTEGLAKGEFSSAELTQDYLSKIHTHDSKYNSFITVSDDRALESAKAADALRAAGKATELTGIPIAVKDIFCTEAFYNMHVC